MSELRSSLKRLLESNQVMMKLLPVGFVLVLIEPVLSFIASLHYIGFYSSIHSIFFIAYLLGLILCFAYGFDWAIGAAFCISALECLISMIRFFSFNALIYTVFYAGIAAYFIWTLAMKNQMGSAGIPRPPHVSYNGNPDYEETPVSDSDSQFCPGCGKPVDHNGKFCPFCGAPYENQQIHVPVVQQMPKMSFNIPHNENQYSGPAGVVASMCSSILALAFTILLTANIVIALIANFSFTTVVAQIPAILICIGCWIIFTGSANNRLNESGFTLISGVLIAELILAYIPIVLGAVLGLILMFQGSDYIGAGLGILIGCIILAVLYTMYWNGLRITSVSARNILRGGEFDWRTSMFSIVLICINLAGQVISLVTISAARAYLSGMLSSLSYELRYATGSSVISEIVMNFLSSLIGGNSGLATFSSILSIAVLACAVVILIQIRSKSKTAGY